MPAELSIDRRTDEDRVVQGGPLRGAERREEVHHVCDDQQATEQQWRDHDTEWEPGDRDRGYREDTEPATSASVTPLVVEKMNPFETFTRRIGRLTQVRAKHA